MRGVTRAAWGSALFFLVAPGVVAGVVPWSITRYTDPAELPVALLGLVIVALGLAALVACFVQFVREGRGTPAPVAPTEKLVVGGLYRWVRNPMYLAVGDDHPRAGGRFRECRGAGLVRGVRRGRGVVRDGVRAAHPAQNLRCLV